MHAQRVAEGLAARGHHVTVLTTRHTPELAREETLNGVHIIRLQPIARVSRGMISPAFPLAAAKLIRSHDVVHVHTPQLEALLAATLCKILRRPLLMTHHGDLVMPKGMFNQIIQFAVSGQMIIAGKLATKVSAYSRDYVNNSVFLQHFIHKIAYIYPPVTLPELQPTEIQRWKHELGLEDCVVVGFAGRFVQEKGFDFLLQAMPIIAEAIPNVRFIFAGEHNIEYENFYNQCLPLIEHNRARIVFLGLIREPQKLANFYGMCDVFTLPSRTDCLAMVQIESLLAGVPLVTTNIPGARIVIQETGFGKLVAPQDHQALAEGIITVLQQPNLYVIDREVVEQIFSVEKIIDSYENVMSTMTQ